MNLLILLLCNLFFLFATFSLTALINAFRRIHKKESKKKLEELGKLFFYRGFHLFFFPKDEYEKIFFSAICAQNTARFSFAATSLLLLLFLFPLGAIWVVFACLAFLFLSFFVGDYLARIFGTQHPNQALATSTIGASLMMLLTFPLTYLYLKFSKLVSTSIYFDYLHEPAERAKQELIDIIHASKMGPSLDLHEKKLLQSVLKFRERVVRSVMVPRIDMFSLETSTPIKEAALQLQDQGFSRIPIYKENLDNIIGVLMYKDILNCFVQQMHQINAPIETLLKPVLYTPETKKISQLLQEFRKEQLHLAIVVDEYGGTQGIVTIEDILEEIVGEIADEYDETEKLVEREPSGAWKVDARTSLLDLEKELGIFIPREGDYDTIGGYIFHLTGTIPPKGFSISHDAFEMQIIESSERCIVSVRIQPRNASKCD